MKIYNHRAKIIKPTDKILHLRDFKPGESITGRFLGLGEDFYAKPYIKIRVFESSRRRSLKRKTFFLNVRHADRIFMDIKKKEFVKFVYNGIDTLEGGKYEGKQRYNTELFLMERE